MTDVPFESVPTIKVGEYDCPNTLGKIFDTNAQVYGINTFPTRIHLNVERALPSYQEEGTDYGTEFYADLPFEIEIEPGTAAWSKFEQAVMEYFERTGDLDVGPEITDQHVSLEQRDQKNWYFENLQEIEKQQFVIECRHGDIAVKDYDWFCVAVEGESCHHGNGWHSGCADCDQEENEVK